MEIGIDSFAAVLPGVDGAGSSPSDRLARLLEEIRTADRSGVDVFGLGEHHRPDFLDSAPTVILAAAAAVTSRIRLTSAVTVLGAADPVRVFQEFATLDLLSRGRAEIVVGRGSFGEAFPLFGIRPQDYDEVFAEKLDLLLALRTDAAPTWSGRHRAALGGHGVYPRPFQDRIPIWLGVGGTPASFARAGALGLPLMVAIIGGGFDRFEPLVALYRRAGAAAGHDPAALRVGIHAMGFVGEDDDTARELFFPGWRSMMSRVGRERGWSPPTRGQFETLCGPSGAFLVGGAETVARKIADADALFGGLSRMTLQMSSAAGDPDAMLRSIELLGTRVVPKERARVTAAT